MRQQKEDSKSSFSRPAELIIEKRHISDTDKQEFCKLHKLELHLKPLGNIRGYPISIDFNCIEKRIKGFQGQLEDIIHGRIQSKFKNIVTNAYNEYGTVKARSAAFLMLRVDKCMPGYYGSQGMAIISSILTKMFIQSDILTKETAKPLLLLEFIQQVLVPEVGIRLIREDLSSKSNMGKSKQTNILHYAPRVPLPNLTEIAEKVMSESREYGSAMFPILEDLVVSLSDEEEQ